MNKIDHWLKYDDKQISKLSTPYLIVISLRTRDIFAVIIILSLVI